jgi:hypothetical protein
MYKKRFNLFILIVFLSIILYVVYKYCFGLLYLRKASSGPYKVKIVDVNADGVKDLVFCFGNAPAIATLFGDGVGGFSYSPIISEFNAEKNGKYLDVVYGVHNFDININSNGLPDLVIGMGGVSSGLSSNNLDKLSDLELKKFYSGRVVLARYSGNGKFEKFLDLPLESHVKDAKFISLRRNGILDFVAVTRGSGAKGDASTGSLVVYANKNSKSVEAQYEPIAFDIGINSYGVAVADMNNNGFYDIIAVAMGGYVQMLTNKLVYNLPYARMHRYYLVPPNINYNNTNDIKIADMDGNGLKDVVAVSTIGKVMILFQKKSNGDKIEFERDALVMDVGETSAYLALADLTNNGFPDIVVTHFRLNKIGIIFNYGNRKFSKMQFLDVGLGPYGVDVGDLTGNGILDIVTANYFSQTYSILFGKGNGKFYPAKTFPLKLSLENGKWISKKR